MLFNSIEFVVFFVVVVALYALFRSHWTLRKSFLLASSYVFYMAWNPPYVILLVFSTLLDYWAGKRIAGSDAKWVRVTWLTLSCVGNLGVLAFFKYADFLVSNLWTFAPGSAVYPDWVTQIILPMGISFYTFQSMSYTIDVYRNGDSLADSFLDFAVYVSFFPQLVAGPIIRSHHFLPQLKENHDPLPEQVLSGFDQVFRGFAKKVILADTLAAYVDIVYEAPGEFGAINHLLAVYAYAFQIYFDFSGYSDIAIGSARILGFNVPVNFRLPYLARGPSDFWTRWHISLSSWLRDYLYISVGGSKQSRLKTYRNLLITMLLGGLWHGASWNFVLWGAFHGTWLAIHRWLIRDRALFTVPKSVSMFFTFHLVCFGWVLFRAGTLPDIGSVLGGFLRWGGPVYVVSPAVLACIAMGFISHGLGASSRLKRKWEESFIGLRTLWYVLVAIGIFLVSDMAAAFIYFQF